MTWVVIFLRSSNRLLLRYDIVMILQHDVQIYLFLKFTIDVPVSLLTLFMTEVHEPTSVSGARVVSSGHEGAKQKYAFELKRYTFQDKLGPSRKNSEIVRKMQAMRSVKSNRFSRTRFLKK